jgi:hypothetical protein
MTCEDCKGRWEVMTRDTGSEGEKEGRIRTRDEGAARLGLERWGLVANGGDGSRNWKAREAG